MKKNEVPQDSGQMEKARMTEVLYVTDEKNNYTTTNSRGWEAKTLALDESMKLIDERAENARQKVKNGTASPIEYFMEKNKMDWGILAAYVGKWAFFVKRDASPKNFKKLPEQSLKKYADIFGITVEELKNFDGKE